MEEGREKQGGEDDHSVSSAASAVDNASNRVPTTVGKEAEEEEEEEAKIEEFFRLLRRVREARKELGIVKSTAGKRGLPPVGRPERLPWTPAFEMQDFSHQAKRLKAATDREVGEDKAKRRKKEVEEGEVSTRLDLGLGSLIK